MPLIIDGVLETNVLKRDYRPAFVKLIEDCMADYDIELFRQFCLEGSYKTFSFAVKFSRPEFTVDKLILGGKEIRLYLTTSSIMDLTGICNGFVKRRLSGNKQIMDGINALRITGVQIFEEETIVDDRVRIKTLSPIIVKKYFKNNRVRYFLFFEECFSHYFSQIVRAQLEQFSDIRLQDEEDVRLMPVRAKKVKIPHIDDQFSGSIGTFYLYGPPPVLNELVKSGIGSMRRFGYGMVNALHK